MMRPSEWWWPYLWEEQRGEGGGGGVKVGAEREEVAPLQPPRLVQR